jgi:exopolyphosphatase/pppGpp-phosphohydrolase
MKLAVIDTGTKATRMLIGDTDRLLREGFSFDLFANYGWRTNMGSWLAPHDGGTSHGDIPLDGTREVIKRLLELRRIARGHGVRRVVAIGTAVWRLAANREELRRHLYDLTGIQLRILQKADEAEYSFLAALMSCQEYYQLGEGILFIDQGGGSTEVACGEYTAEGVTRFYGLESLDLGTVILRNRFVANPRRHVRRCYEEVRDESVRIVEEHDFSRTLNPVEGRLRTCFAVGSAISYATGKQCNRLQHGAALGAESLESHCKRVVEKYIKGDPQAADAYDRRSIGSLLKEHSGSGFDADLDMVYGLPVYAALLRKFHLPNLIMCGCGLRYGIFFAQALQHDLQLETTPWPG